MSDTAMIIDGMLFEGCQPVGIQIRLAILDDEAVLTGAGDDRVYRTSQLTVTPRIGRADRFVNLPDGAELQCTDLPCLDLLPSESPTEGLVAWLERRTLVAGCCVVLITLSLLCAYNFGLPAATAWAITKVSLMTEQGLGKDAFTWLDSNQWLQATELDETRKEHIRTTFSALTTGLKFGPNYLLEFRRSKRMGANAIALPGGIIVITDEMVSLADTDEEIAAVLAHEIGHVELRHALKQLMQGSLLTAVAGVVTNDASSYAVAVAGLPALLAQTQYSRKLESEADDFAFALLKRHHISPAAFASVMEKLSSAHAEDSSYSFLSNHPLTADRVRRAREAGE